MEKRSLSTTIRVSESEMKKIQNNADKIGLPVATYIRMVSMKGVK